MKKNNLILSHPTGNANVRALAEGLLENELLLKFYTCIALFENSALYPFTGIGQLRELRKRLFSKKLKPFTKSREYKELLRLASEKTGQKRFVSHETGLFSIDRVYRDLDRYVSSRISKANGVYAYEDGALQIFKKAKEKGINCFYDLPIGHWRAMRKLLEEERQLNPEWAVTLNNFKDSEDKLWRKDEELRLADQIFVASSFTEKTLELFPDKLNPIHVIPYGFPEVNADKKYNTSSNNRPIKILYVGGLSQRKGISYMFKAIKKYSRRIDLTIVGKKVGGNCKVLDENLKEHTWIPSMAHQDLLELMRKNDLLIFPSLFEGFGLVITEAMSQGTPVITTERTCGPDFIRQDENGWIVKAGSQEALEQQLEKIITKPEILREVGINAGKTAEQRPWSVYANELSSTIIDILNTKAL